MSSQFFTWTGVRWYSILHGAGIIYGSQTIGDAENMVITAAEQIKAQRQAYIADQVSQIKEPHAHDK